MSKELITINELAIILNVKESWIRRHVFIDTIPYLKIGRLIRFNKEQILEHFNINSNKED